jgi:hypothetical protein
VEQTQAVWLLTGLALASAGLPFWLRRPLLCLPWTSSVLPAGPAWQRALLSVLHLALLALWAWAAMALVGHSLVASATGQLLRVLLLLAVLAALLWGPGFWPAGHWRSHPAKPFISRLIETLALYLLVGTLGFALETQLGNPFAQNWEFYAITLCLYVVMAFPGFVYRYLLHRA